MSIGDRPKQDDVDSLASFVEAVAELDSEPFFSRDEPRKLSSSGDKFTYHLGDRFHFRSALITFRRIWMKGDAENFEHVCNVIWKFTPPPSNMLLAFVRAAIRKELDQEPQWPRPINVQGRKLVDLWLNAVFAHSGLAGGVKLRHEFDALVEQYGNGRLEFAFRHIVWSLGIQYKNVVQLAKNLLETWRRDFGLLPSFKLGSAFGSKRRERTTDGDLIIRESSSEFFSEETYEQRFHRILRRPEFSTAESVLSILQFTERELLRFVMKHDSYAGVVRESMLELTILEKAPQSHSSIGGFRSFAGLVDVNRGVRSSIYSTDTNVVTDATGLTIIDRLLAEFKHQLLHS